MMAARAKWSVHVWRVKWHHFVYYLQQKSGTGLCFCHCKYLYIYIWVFKVYLLSTLVKKFGDDRHQFSFSDIAQKTLCRSSGKRKKETEKERKTLNIVTTVLNKEVTQKQFFIKLLVILRLGFRQICFSFWGQLELIWILILDQL